MSSPRAWTLAQSESSKQPLVGLGCKARERPNECISSSFLRFGVEDIKSEGTEARSNSSVLLQTLLSIPSNKTLESVNPGTEA